MPSRILASSLLTAMFTAAPAAAGDHGSTLEIDADAIRAHVEFLADDLLEGRRAGTRGYDIAAAYVATQFRLYGLEPGGDDGTFLQHFDLLQAEGLDDEASVVLRRGGQDIVFRVRDDFLPWSDVLAPASRVEAPLVYAGYGISAPELGFDDLSQVDLKGKVAVVLTGAPASFPNSQRAYYSRSRLKYARLKAAGAVGVITVPTRVDQARVPWQRRLDMSWAPSMAWRSPDGRTSVDGWSVDAGVSFRGASAAPLFEGAPAGFEAVLDAADAGEPLAFELPGRVEIRTASTRSQGRSSNVLGILPGTDPDLRDEYIIITAHLDHIGIGKPVDGDAVYNGAWDNATGVAVMLEVARALKDSGSPRRSVLFAAVGAEEVGLIGSDYFAEYPTVPLEHIVANLNIDMPYAAAPTRDFVAFGAEHTSLGPVAAAAAEAEGYRLSPDPIPEEVIFVRSDQFSFVQRGIPAIYLDGGYVPRDPDVDLAALTKAFLQTHYHGPGDDTSLPIPYETLAGLGRVNARIVMEVGNDSERPAWNPGDFFGQAFGGGTAAP
ncbi:MAG: M28 family metallopeptidase [Gammaproteobacteria bacterium]